MYWPASVYRGGSDAVFWPGSGIVNGTAVPNTPSAPAPATERFAVVAEDVVPSLLCAST